MPFVKGHKSYMTEEVKRKISNTLKGKTMGSKNHRFKCGRYTAKSGYVMILPPTGHPLLGKKKYIQEHRVVMEKHINRCLRCCEIVHHNNGIKDDNRIENLTLYSDKSSHQKEAQHNLKSNSGSFQKGHRLGMTGKKHSEETKRKIRETNIKTWGAKAEYARDYAGG